MVRHISAGKYYFKGMSYFCLGVELVMLTKCVNQPQETNNKDIKDNAKEHVVRTAAGGRSVSYLFVLWIN